MCTGDSRRYFEDGKKIIIKLIDLKSRYVDKMNENERKKKGIKNDLDRKIGNASTELHLGKLIFFG